MTTRRFAVRCASRGRDKFVIFTHLIKLHMFTTKRAVTIGQLFLLPLVSLSNSTEPTLDEWVISTSGTPLFSQPTIGARQMLELEPLAPESRANLTDLFRETPGVYAVSEDGGRQGRLSVRGSGLQNRFGGAGLQLLYNDIPLNRADGSFETQAIDPTLLSAVEVLPGGSGFQTGAPQLGGAIRFQSVNGLTAPGSIVRLSAGSWGTFSGHLAHGWQSTDNNTASEHQWEGHIAVFYSESDGFRENSERRERGVNTNFGLRHSGNQETRIFVLASEGRRRLPGGLSLEEIRQNPRASLQPTVPWRRDIDDALVVVRHAWLLPDGTIRLSAFGSYTRFDHPVSNPPTNFEFEDRYRTGGLRFDGEHAHALGGVEQMSQFGVHFTHTHSHRRGTQPVFVFPFPRAAIENNQDANLVNAFVLNRWMLHPRFDLEAGLLAFHTTRKQDNRQNPASNFNRSYNGLLPRLALEYRPIDNLSLHGSITRSIEPPRFSTLADDIDIRAQKARTIEFGATVTNERSDTLELTFFRSNIKDRFIYVTTPPQVVAQTRNTDAIHQGVEAALSLDLTPWLLLPQPVESVSWRQALTWNDFRFDGDPVHGNNRLPMVPKFAYFSALRVGLGERFHSELNVCSAFGDRPADNANSTSVASYVVWGLHFDYAHNENTRLFLAVRNLTNTRRVESFALTDVLPTIPGNDRIFNPLEPRAIQAGITIAF